MDKKDVRSFDWDDAPLRKAYSRWESQKKEIKGKKENKKRKWNVGDYCRVLYSDELYYEAKIISLNGDFCTIRFLGFNEEQDVDLLELKESDGRKARQLQINVYEYISDEDDSSENEASDGSDENYNFNKKKHQAKKLANKATVNIPMRRAPNRQRDISPPVARAPPSSMAVSVPPVRRQAPKPQYSVPPAPPMLPQNSALAGNPDISSLITAWYMAGYYTGLQHAQAENGGYSTTPVESDRKK